MYCYEGTIITWERVVKETLFCPRTQLNDALIESYSDSRLGQFS